MRRPTAVGLLVLAPLKAVDPLVLFLSKKALEERDRGA